MHVALRLTGGALIAAIVLAACRAAGCAGTLPATDARDPAMGAGHRAETAGSPPHECHDPIRRMHSMLSGCIAYPSGLRRTLTNKNCSLAVFQPLPGVAKRS